MRRTASAPFGVSLIVGLALAVVLALVWATAAHANHTRSSADDQYGTPTPPSGPLAAGSVDVSDDADGAIGSGGGSGGGSSGGEGPSGVAGVVTDVLPATGGLLLLLPLGVLAISGAGLVLIGRLSTAGRR